MARIGKSCILYVYTKMSFKKEGKEESDGMLLQRSGKNYQAWRVDAADYPGGGTTEEQLFFLLVGSVQFYILK